MAKDPNEQKIQEAADRAAKEATEKAMKEAAERSQVDACRRALEPLADIQPKAPGFGEAYEINRAGQTARITAADIEAARRVRADPAATLAAARRALEPLAKLPVDHTVEDRMADLYQFPDGNGRTVGISISTIMTARRLTA
jgi:hypothetical protein